MDKRLLKNWLTRHMMRSVSERYSFLHAAGLSLDFLSRQNLEKAPFYVALDLINAIEGYTTKEEIFQALGRGVLELPLPGGIPAPEDK